MGYATGNLYYVSSKQLFFCYLIITGGVYNIGKLVLSLFINVHRFIFIPQEDI